MLETSFFEICYQAAWDSFHGALAHVQTHKRLCIYSNMKIAIIVTASKTSSVVNRYFYSIIEHQVKNGGHVHISTFNLKSCNVI